MRKLVRSLHVVAAALGLSVLPAAAAEQPPQDPQAQGAQDAFFRQKRDIKTRIGFIQPNGCHYTADVSGTVTPVEAKGEGGVQHVTPDIRVDATVACPNGVVMKTSDTVVRTGPLTAEAFERALERRGSVLSKDAGRQCIYRPDFEIIGDALTGVRVSYMCLLGNDEAGRQGS
ncbi:hypothetical protein [Polyangium aurulentum]|uniref:hypothetical protein n=1 Tax=Polyangium aurulentum TaxID=2567896 RepID=UPI0010AE787C|nr:hypothetical protein [Polyangium aurulentum]UQA56852.1 hypothetical protein E8A73_036965 [Polyangium aurulentum]